MNGHSQTKLFTFRLESGPSLTPPEIAGLDFREGPDPSNPPGISTSDPVKQKRYEWFYKTCLLYIGDLYMSFCIYCCRRFVTLVTFSRLMNISLSATPDNA